MSFLANATNIGVLGKHQRADGSIYEFQVQDGDALSPGDSFQIIIHASEALYYAVVYVSRDGKASQLFPLAGRQGAMRPGAKLVLPTQENYFTLDTNGGRELMFVVTSANPLTNIKSALKGVESVGNSSREIQQYLDNRLANVTKLEIINTGGRVSNLADQVSSSLVRDLSASYAKNPWTESDTMEPSRRKRTRQADDSTIPEEVRRRAQEVRALLQRPAGAPDTSSLRTTKAQAPDTRQPAGLIRRDAPMLAVTGGEQNTPANAKPEPIVQEESVSVDAENNKLQEQREAAAKAAQEIKRLEKEKEAARLSSEQRLRQRDMAEADRIADENKRLEAEHRAAAMAQEESLRLEEERAAAEKASAETWEIEQQRIEMAKAEDAARRLREEQQAAARAAEEIKRLELERDAARLAAEERRREEAQIEAERVARENERLQAERAAAEHAAAEIKRLEEEKEARALAAETKSKETEQKPTSGFLGAITSIFSGSSSEGEQTADKAGESVEEKVAVDLVLATEDTSQTIEPVVETTPRAPAEAVVVLKAPARSEPPKLTAPAPVRVEVTQAPSANAADMRRLYGQVASSIVAVRTTNDTQASGFILDTKGHVLTSWHVISGVNDIDVYFMGVAGLQRGYKAQVVGQDKFRDLALLKLVNPPEGIQPIVLASGSLPDAGTTVRVFGQSQGEVWATDDAVITRIAPNFTWFSTDNVIHRGEILQVDLPTRGKGIGALVTTMDYRMLGIKSFSGQETGRTYAVSVNSILEFLQPDK